MNEWSVNNKKDTLFVFSALFVGLCIILVFTVLLRMSIIGSGLWGTTCGITILIFILIVLNRAQYTDQLRNKQYWNKKNFDKKNPPITSVCPTPAPTDSGVPSGMPPSGTTTYKLF
jgi:hypothetical protein